MQKVVQFKQRNFWSSQINLVALNSKIAEYNQAGWRVVSITPNSVLIGLYVESYTLLLEKN